MDREKMRARLGRGAKVLVIGAGRSGIAATKLLLKNDLTVDLFDDHKLEHLRFFNDASLSDEKNLKTHFGAKTDVILTGFAAVILSPGVSLDHVLVKRAQAGNVPVLSEIDLASIFSPPHVMIGITGTNGKSTTTAMITSILNASGRKAVACGNIGIPLSDMVLKYQGPDLSYFVVELSSFQLETTSLAKLDRAVILNMTPDHLDRYESLDAYERAKCKIRGLLKKDGLLMVNESLKNHPLLINSFFAWFSSEQFGDGKFRHLAESQIVGDHNRENAAAAVMVATSLGLKPDHIDQGLQDFRPLPHRCEIIANRDGITYINDSKGTTVVAVRRALSMFRSPTHLLLGGIEKGEDFSQLSPDHFSHIAGYYVFGQAAPKIMSELNSSKANLADNLKNAFTLAQSRAKHGDIVLLSPGCASFDQFNDYHHRGETFRALVYGARRDSMHVVHHVP